MGSTSNLLELKFSNSQRSVAFKEMGLKHNSMQNHLMESQFSRNMSPSKLNISNLKPINEQNQSVHHDGDDISLIDTTKDRKELNAEFDQVTIAPHTLSLIYL